MLITLPYPISVNQYWRRAGRHMHISKKGRDYRKNAVEIVEQQMKAQGSVTATGRLSVAILAYMPDRRVRDLDNILKSLLDSLSHAGAMEDDGQIDRILVQRCGIEKPGRVEVLIKPFDATMG